MSRYSLEVKVKLRDYLSSHNLSAYKLAKAVEGVGADSIYAYSAGRKKPSLEALGQIAAALSSLTGQKVEPGELLEFVSTPVMDEETRAWMDAGLAPALEPYDWGNTNPNRIGKPVKYVPGVGLVVEGAKR
ncbi:MAG: helix-turn-helix transcriptional regulator [Thermaceae bacterium]|nr:helix-turn-helix transcriptional regulator [Thermaceae bacterium]